MARSESAFYDQRGETVTIHFGPLLSGSLPTIIVVAFVIRWLWCGRHGGPDEEREIALHEYRRRQARQRTSPVGDQVSALPDRGGTLGQRSNAQPTSWRSAYDASAEARTERQRVKALLDTSWNRGREDAISGRPVNLSRDDDEGAYTRGYRVGIRKLEDDRKAGMDRGTIQRA